MRAGQHVHKVMPADERDGEQHRRVECEHRAADDSGIAEAVNVDQCHRGVERREGDDACQSADDEMKIGARAQLFHHRDEGTQSFKAEGLEGAKRRHQN